MRRSKVQAERRIYAAERGGRRNLSSARIDSSSIPQNGGFGMRLAVLSLLEMNLIAKAPRTFHSFTLQ
jgi:hypothetical protein